jgi:hypothetical protein
MLRIASKDTPCYHRSPAMDGRRPAFASDFPRGPALDALVDAFARGDYAHVRAEGPRLAESTEDPAVREAAKTLVDRTKPDPLAVGLLVLTGVLLVAMTGYWIVNGKAPPGSGSGSVPAHPTVEHPR